MGDPFGRRRIRFMKKSNASFFFAAVAMTLAFSLLSWSDLCARETQGDENLPSRAISVAPEYTGVVVPEGEEVSLDLSVRNGGRQDEVVHLELTSVPKGWKAQIKTYSFEVTGVHVKSDSSKSLTLKAEPGEDISPGDYVFSVRGQTQDGALVSASDVTIHVIPKEEKKEPEGVLVTTSYPVLQGPTDAEFEFSVQVENKLDEDTIFNLLADGPRNWEINFKPSWEDKYFSSLRVKGNLSETMAVEVKPHALADPGTYPIKVKVKSETAEAEAELRVVLTGTYQLDVGTPTGLLSLNAYQGRESRLSFYVKNSGSAAQNNVRFLSFKPENWKVTFEPEKIDSLDPGEVAQVEGIITPAEQALVGDYAVSVSVEGEKQSKELELRVTVKASTAWGWIGIGIIVVVIAGLVTLFVRMGRR
jgi:uncharacterized membrane protein